jgi:hypothetical protein
LFLAACSSSAQNTLPDAAVIVDGDPGTSGLSCAATLTNYCSVHDCQRTLDGAKQDPDLCPAQITPCGDHTVITHINIDSSTTYYYQQGALLAINHRVLPMGTACLAGPTTFAPPTCTEPGQTLPACSR